MKNLLFFFVGLSFGGSLCIYKVYKKNAKHINEVKRLNRKADNHFRMFVAMQQWVQLKEKGIEIADLLKNQGYNNIVLYGMNGFAETLIETLTGTGINVACCVDKNADKLFSSIKIVSNIEEISDGYDVILVTAFLYFDEIASEIYDKVRCPIISFEDLIFDVEM